MAPYIVCFLGSCVFARMDSLFKKKHFKGLSIFFALLAILLPCILAGARDVGVGTDTEAYARPLFSTITRHGYSLIELLNSPYSDNIEPFTLIMYYIIRKFTDNIFWVFFFTELVCLVPVYLAIRESEIKPELKWLALFAYYCLFYCYTLNIMRQMMAICILFYCTKFLKRGETGKYLLCVVLTLLVHKTAVLGLIICILYTTCTKKKIDIYDLFIVKKRTIFDNIGSKLYRKRKILLLFYIGISLCIILLARNLILLLSSVKESFAYQVMHMNSSFNLSFAPLLLMFMYIAPFLLSYNKLVKRNSIYRFFFFSSFISIILWQLQGISGETYRIVLYIWFYIILAIPFWIQSNSGRLNRVLLSAYYFVILFVNWYYYFAVCNSGEVIPYTSEMLGIR